MLEISIDEIEDTISEIRAYGSAIKATLNRTVVVHFLVDKETGDILWNDDNDPKFGNVHKFFFEKGVYWYNLSLEKSYKYIALELIDTKFVFTGSNSDFYNSRYNFSKDDEMPLAAKYIKIWGYKYDISVNSERDIEIKFEHGVCDDVKYGLHEAGFRFLAGTMSFTGSGYSTKVVRIANALGLDVKVENEMKTPEKLAEFIRNSSRTLKIVGPRYKKYELHFDGYPGSGVIAYLKYYGFKWNSKNSCWTGKCTDSNVLAVIEVLNNLNKG